MFKLIDKPRTLKATKSLAQKFAEMPSVPNDRPLSPRRMKVYRKMRKEGMFRPVTWATGMCMENNITYRVNGKHTSTLLSTEDSEFPNSDDLPDMYVTIEEYLCETLQDIAELYSTFDSATQNRNARDIYMSFAGVIPHLSGIPERHISTAVAGMALHLNAGNRTHYFSTPAERAENLFEYPEFVIWLHKIYSCEDLQKGAGEAGKNILHIRRAPVAAAMMGCWQKSQTAATAFWKAVRDESGFPQGVPDRKLAKYLSTTGVSTGRGVKAKIKTADYREMYVKCIAGWNAWRAGETTNLNYYEDKDVPKFR